MTEVGLSQVLTHLSKFERGAHHPHCEFHHHHIVRPFGRPLCLGCFCMWTGIALGLASLLINANTLELSAFSLIFLGFSMAPFPFIQIYFQQRWFKLLARTALGYGSSLLLGATLLLLPLDTFGWVLRFSIVIGYAVLARLALMIRNDNMDDPCDGCQEGAFPLCTWKMAEISEIQSKWDLDQETHDFLSSILQSFEDDNSNLTIMTGEEVLRRSSEGID